MYTSIGATHDPNFPKLSMELVGYTANSLQLMYSQKRFSQASLLKSNFNALSGIMHDILEKRTVLDVSIQLLA
jgi:hypothetical protein